jgi:hypothetical protein
VTNERRHYDAKLINGPFVVSIECVHTLCLFSRLALFGAAAAAAAALGKAVVTSGSRH